MSTCAWCGVPTALRFGATPRCRRCAATAVDRSTDLTEVLFHVGQAMSSRGLVVQRHVDLILSNPAELQRRGIHWGNPHNLGVTQTAVDQSGRTKGKITIGIVSGLPEALFRAVLVHEFAHAYLAGLPRPPAIQAKVEEGFAEALAYEYLEQDLATAEAIGVMASMKASRDPVYGDGLRLMLPWVQQEGAFEVAKALAQGTLGPVDRGRRRTRPVSR